MGSADYSGDPSLDPDPPEALPSYVLNGWNHLNCLNGFTRVNLWRIKII